MKSLTILGLTVALPRAYRAGDVLTQNEADTLTKLRTRGLAKSLHKFLSEDRSPRNVQQVHAEQLVASYVKGFSQGHERLRAIDSVARQIATIAVESRLYAQGKSRGEIGEATFTASVAEVAQSVSVREEATRRVDDLATIARTMYDNVGLSGGKITSPSSGEDEMEELLS